jgi:MoaA/NifB/PqqE/SkfB family radical SAM enzyme
LKKLLDSNLRVINVSLDAGTAATYQKIRGFSFERVIGNLERFIAARRARGQTYPLLFLNMTMMRSNIEELDDFIRLAARLGADETLLWHLNHWSEDEMARYVVEREGWVFDYAKEGLWNFPALSNGSIRQAIDLARELGVRLSLGHNTENFFDEVDAAA